MPKGERRLEGFDERIVSLYARGMSVREIRGHLEEMYGVSVSPDLISRVTDAVLEEVRDWQNRTYPLRFSLSGGIRMFRAAIGDRRDKKTRAKSRQALQRAA